MSYQRSIWAFLLCGALAFTAIATTAAEEPAMAKKEMADGDRIDHVGTPTVIIGVSASGIVPPTTRARTDQALAWLSFTNREVTVSFDAKVADEMICKKPSAFEIEDGRLTATLKNGAFASFCKLRFGQYNYEVVIHDGAGSERKLAGVITVE